ncbi:MAG: threonine--tRNA ligase [Coxiellaceae bacterium]|nr:threonine--tRNA ligase [Coxiellaceae bacterium]
MPNVTLADKSVKQFDHEVTCAEVAAAIGPGLAKAAVAAEVDGQLVDLSHQITADSQLRLITTRDEESQEVIRHSTAHLLAQAVKELYPSCQVTIGPVIDDGFYYDIAFERSFTPEDLEAIEKKMAELAKQNFEITRRELSRDEAIKLFEGMGEHYKVEIIKDLPADEALSVYQQGDFVDLCRGPHVPNTRFLQAFKLMKLAGAYWRGDSNNEMLQRIYGTAWADKKQLKAYLHRLAEAEKRDHRKLATSMDLFHLQQEAPGMIFWHPNGWTLNSTLRDYVREVQVEAGYQEVNTPMLVDNHLWELSGHTSKFDDDMFVTPSENRDYIVKPMNCPCHVQIYNQKLRSYRDLPIRYAEFGSCHRNEPSGTLHGLMRLRGFVQDDAHIFCTEDQIHPETTAFIEQIYKVYQSLGFDSVIVKLSTRPEKRVGTEEQWDKTEGILADILNDAGLDWEYNPGEGAFYGPKVEFSLKDCLGRVWQCGTIQVDPSTPSRLGATYIAEDGSKQVPYMLHRAMLGSLERFLGILLEEHAGKLPLWLAPIQLVVMNVSDAQADFCIELDKKLKKYGFKVRLDLRNEKIGFKIREHTLAKVPYQLIIGDKEVAGEDFALRAHDGSQVEGQSFERLVDYLQAEIDRKHKA